MCLIHINNVSSSVLLIDDPRHVASAASGASRNTSRRKRTSFTKEHVELLRITFLTDPYPGISLRESLSQKTGLPESRIQVCHTSPLQLCMHTYTGELTVSMEFNDRTFLFLRLALFFTVSLHTTIGSTISVLLTLFLYI